MSESFETFYKKTKEQYAPSLMEYTPVDMETLRQQIVSWLRPSYDKALKKQEKQAALYNGKLDADAWSRGMGSSTYVSDLKYRRQNELLENRADIEASYGAALAEQLYKAWEKERSYRLEVEEFNAKAQNEANAKALSAAEKLYQSYLDSLNSHSSGSGGTQQKSTEDSVAKMVEKAQAGKLLTLKNRQVAKNTKTQILKRGNTILRDLVGGTGKITQSSFVQE